MQIIPAINLMEGKVIRLTQEGYRQKKEYNGRPLAVAQQVEDAGLTRLHLIDLEGAKEQRLINWKVLELIAAKTQLQISFSGGIQSDEDLRIALESGAKQVVCDRIAVKKPAVFESWLTTVGPHVLILEADVHSEKVIVSGCQGSTSAWVYEFVEKYVEQGGLYIISTDVTKNGWLQGPSFDLYRNLQDRFPGLSIIANGEVRGLEDIEKLADMNLYGMIVSNAIYEGRIPLNDLLTFN